MDTTDLAIGGVKLLSGLLALRRAGLRDKKILSLVRNLLAILREEEERPEAAP